VGITDRIQARVEQRTIGGTPWLPFVPFGQGGPVHPSKYHIGQEHALRLAPMYAAVKLLADGVASLPLKIYRTVDSKTVPWTGPSMFDSPSPRTTYYDWMFQGMSSLLLHGNALGFVTSRDGFGYPQQIVWLPPEHCDIIDDETQDFASPVKARYFYFGRQLDVADLVHVRAFTMAGHTAGLSPLAAFKALIEGGLDQQEYSKLWFANGGFPPGVFRNTELEVDADISKQIRGTLTETLRRRQPLVIGRDWEYTPISVKPDEAQFVETTRLTATEFAAIYQVPPERIGGSRGDSMTYASQEMATNDMISWSLRPWLVRWEDVFDQILPNQRYAKFNVDALLRTDTHTRYLTHQIARDTGWLSNNEIRDIEDQPPISGAIGDETLPNQVLVAMARGMASIPKSFDSQLVTQKPPAPAAAPHMPGQPAALPPGTPGTPPAPAKQLTVQPPGGTPPVAEPDSSRSSGGHRWSLEQIARRCYGPLAAKQEYLDLVACAARDAGYVVTSARAENFSQEQADWIASDALRRPSPIEHFGLNGNGREAARHG
jgi:HK97 family phage portal protein